MKKILILVISLLLFLVACNDDSNTKEDTTETSKNNKTEQNEKEDEVENDNENNSDDGDNDSSNEFEVGKEDQLDLGLGDTGVFDTTLGTYEITLLSAELVDDINGEKSQLEKFIILDFIVKNTSDETQDVADLIYSLEVTEDLAATGFPDGAEYFDGFEKLEGSIEPNEEMEGQFVTDVADAPEYYFRKKVGNVEAGSSNQVIWTIKADEAK